MGGTEVESNSSCSSCSSTSNSCCCDNSNSADNRNSATSCFVQTTIVGSPSSSPSSAVVVSVMETAGEGVIEEAAIKTTKSTTTMSSIIPTTETRSTPMTRTATNSSSAGDDHIDATMQQRSNTNKVTMTCPISGQQQHGGSKRDLYSDSNHIKSTKATTTMMMTSSNTTTNNKKVGSSSSRGAAKTGYSGSARWTQIDMSRTVVLRSILIASLLAAVITCATLSYLILKRTEVEVGRQTYVSIAASALSGAQAITSRKLQGSEVMATVVSHMLPMAEQWPFIAIDGYIPISEKIAKLSSSTTQSLMVFVNPDDINAWEDHTYEMYRKQNRPLEAGLSDFGFGVWSEELLTVQQTELVTSGTIITENMTTTYPDGRIHDTSGEATWGGKYRVIAPLMFHNQPTTPSLLFNVYSEKDRGVHLESMFSCVEESRSQNETSSPECAVITDMLELKIRPGPAGLLFQPIYPANDPTTFVGFATTSIHWQEILESIVPDYVNGLTCVVSTATQAYTYEIRNGNPELVGNGDLHDPEYTNYARSVILNDIKTGAETSAVYTLTVYPTKEMFYAFSTNSPLAIALGFFGVIALCAFLFFMYDYLMRSEANQRKTILEMKRRFVRFISHEIRTPLNTVCMGLELLESELRHPTADDPVDSGSVREAMCENNGGATSLHTNDVSRNTGEEVTEDDVEFWHKVTVDIKENAHIAVAILNDLLNYDKLESGTLKLEANRVPVWDLVQRTANQFRIQAVNKNINLKLDVRPPQIRLGNDNGPMNEQNEDIEAGSGHSPSEPTEHLQIIGDDVRMSQVFRNIISNAMKFTPEGGTIEISAYHVPNGLPHAKPLLDPESNSVSDLCVENPRAGSIRIKVKDSGVGLSKEQMALLFGEGVQFDANRLQHGGGSGLGLSIAKGIVEQHSGAIFAESEGTGRGTSFTVDLPLYEFSTVDKRHREKMDMSVSDTMAMTELNSSTDNHSTNDGQQPTEDQNVTEKQQHMRILVAEDAASSRKMLMRLLERAGHSCIPAANGQEAVDAIREDMEALKENAHSHGIDCVLMDFEMPILKGPEATRIMRDIGYRGTILGITGNVLSEDVDFFKQHGADEVFPKPVSMERIKTYWAEQRDLKLRKSRRKMTQQQRCTIDC